MALSLADQIALASDGDFVKRTMAALVAAAIAIYNEVVSELQRITITGNPTGGTFTVTYQGVTSAPIAFNANAATVQAALQAMSTIGNGNVVCTGGPLPGAFVNVTFAGTLANLPLNLLTATSSLTGGVAPAVTPSRVTAGVAVANHATKAVLANKVLNNPLGYAQLFAPGVAADANVQGHFSPASAWQPTSDPDADITSRVSAIFPAYA